MSGESRVIVVVPGVGALALEVGAYRRALAEGAALVGAPISAATAEEPALDAEPLLDAAQLASALGLPVTRIEAAARSGSIPAVRLGRRYRFRRSSVEAALAANGKGVRG